jgi:hypothetical protein
VEPVVVGVERLRGDVVLVEAEPMRVAVERPVDLTRGKQPQGRGRSALAGSASRPGFLT